MEDSRYKFRAWDNVENMMYYTGEEEDVVFYFDSSGIVAEKISGVEVVGHTAEVSYDQQIEKLEHLIYMQYTGLKDKNGTEIFTGDIVRISDHPFQGSIDIDGNYVVGYDENMELCCGSLILFRNRYYAEVIGNKYENPDLLKEE